MEDFNNYKIANISENYKDKFSQLENSIANDTNKNIVVIAYEKK